jgi:hypothetical protein
LEQIYIIASWLDIMQKQLARQEERRRTQRRLQLSIVAETESGS